MLPSLVLQGSALSSANSGQTTVVQASYDGKENILVAAQDKILVLDGDACYQGSIEFRSAFPYHKDADTKIQALSFDASSGRIAACCNGSVAIWHNVRGLWRVHSSITVPFKINAIDCAGENIAISANDVSVWKMDGTSTIPQWSKSGWEDNSASSGLVRLSPTAQVLASVKIEGSLVRLSSIIQDAESKSNSLTHRSFASHSVRIRSVSWRPSDDPADSGPILFTCTMDGVFRIWGCMIDDPGFFSLWATLDVHSSIPGAIPLASCYHATSKFSPHLNDATSEKRNGAMDDFITVFSDGSMYMTTVSNFDSRPPTCLAQTSVQIDGAVFTSEELANLRFPLISSDPSLHPHSFTLLCRSNLGTIILRRIQLPLPSSKRPQLNSESLPQVAVNLAGHIAEIVSTGGPNFLCVGENGDLQSWGCNNEGVIANFTVAKAVRPGAKCIICDTSKTLGIATSEGLSFYKQQGPHRLVMLATFKTGLPNLLCVFPLLTDEMSTRSLVVAVTKQGNVLTWSFDTTLNKIELLATQSIALENPNILLVLEVPSQAATFDGSLLVIESDGTLTLWSSTSATDNWVRRRSTRIETFRKNIKHAVCSSSKMTAMISLDEAKKTELSLWDSRESEFTTGAFFITILDYDSILLQWSTDGQTLAVSGPHHVDLYSAQLLDDFTNTVAFGCYARIEVGSLVPNSISAISWIPNGLAVACGEHLLYYGLQLNTGKPLSVLASERCAPLPYHHPQLLFQALLHGHVQVVIKILARLAEELTPDGDVTPIADKTSRTPKIDLMDFLKRDFAEKKESNDIFDALTTASNDRGYPIVLTENAASRLLAVLRKCGMRGLTRMEHAHLGVLVQTVFEIQNQRAALDHNGLRYLVSMRSFFLYNDPTTLSSTVGTSEGLSLSRIRYRDIAWAFHSDSQELLLDATTKAAPGRIDWPVAKALGLFLWLKSAPLLSQQLEAVGKAQYFDPKTDERDPIFTSLLFLALRKKYMVTTFWKQASGHSDQRSMLKFLSNDFEQPRWRSAALKNAYALLSKQRFMFAAAFFLLAESLKDAVNVCLRQLDDFQLAIAITRVHEGDDGPILRLIIEETVLPYAFEHGFRWLASWSFWMLKRRDLAVQTIITPLSSLAARLEYPLKIIGSPTHEDPCLILLFDYLRSWSLQTVKGAIAVSGSTEFNFVLHICRVLCRMGCHVLALSLVQSWIFIKPQAARPMSHFDGPRHSLRRLSTKVDMDIPSNLGSRAPSPDRKATIDDTLGTEFHSVLRKAKKEAQAPAEFNFDSFAF